MRISDRSQARALVCHISMAVRCILDLIKVVLFGRCRSGFGQWVALVVATCTGHSNNVNRRSVGDLTSM